MLTATLTTPAGQTIKMVEVVATNRGWTTIRIDGVESKVRNGQLTEYTDLACRREYWDAVNKARLVMSRF